MCNFFNSCEESLHWGVWKFAKYVRNCVVFWKNLHSWKKFYTTAGRDGRDKFQVWVHYTRRAPVHQFSVTLHCTSVLALHWCACTTPVCLQCTSVTVHCTTSTCISPPCILKPQGSRVKDASSAYPCIKCIAICWMTITIVISIAISDRLVKLQKERQSTITKPQ